MIKEKPSMRDSYDTKMWIKVIEQAAEIEDSRVHQDFDYDYRVYSDDRFLSREAMKCVVFRSGTGEILRYSIANPRERRNWRVFTDSQLDWVAIDWVFNYLQHRFINGRDDD